MYQYIVIRVMKNSTYSVVCYLYTMDVHTVIHCHTAFQIHKNFIEHISP